MLQQAPEYNIPREKIWKPLQPLAGIAELGPKMAGEQIRSYGRTLEAPAKDPLETAFNVADFLPLGMIASTVFDVGKGKLPASRKIISETLEPLAQEARKKITLYHGTESSVAGAISKKNLDFGTFLTSSKQEALDYAKMRAKNRGTKPVVKSFTFSPDEVKLSQSTGEWQYLGGKQKFSGQKFPPEFYEKYNQSLGSNLTVEEINSQTDIWDVAQAISGYDILKTQKLLGIPETIKTKSQLTDFYTQATGK